MGAPTSPAVMRDALMAARKVIAAEMRDLINDACCKDAEGNPDLKTADIGLAPYVKRFRGAIRKIDDALGRRGKGVRRGR